MFKVKEQLLRTKMKTFRIVTVPALLSCFGGGAQRAEEEKEALGLGEG